ncbi:MAG TPA: polysaccharide pyruvyl transferase family protein, partial [Acidimicrobiia bacterium]|nr:polysaccharide pyruvyl transferase family protein [Acidimicrobiia bacterium]
MTRILVRSGKDPFDVVSPHVTLRDNVIGNNVGNLVFSNAVHKLLTTSRTDTVSTRFRADARDAPQINAEFSAFAIPLANAFRPGFADALDRLSELIEKLTIPVVVVGVGAQAI